MSTESRASLRASMAVQARVIHALLMREVITRFGRHNLGVLWLIGEPMMFTLGIAALWSAAGMRSHSTIPIIAFAVTGYSSVLLWRNTVSRASSAIAQNFNLLYHRNVQVLDVFVARNVLEMAGATASFILLSVVFVALGAMPVPGDMLKVLLGWFMLAWFGMALSFVVGAATAYSEVVDRLWHTVSYLLFPVSGAAFMVDWLPAKAQAVVLALPMVHGVEMLRDGFFGDLARTHYDLGYMAMCNLVLMAVGLFLIRDAARKVESA